MKKQWDIGSAHDQCGPTETIYALPIVVCPLCLPAGAALLPNKELVLIMARAQSNNPCLFHLPKEALGPSYCLLCCEMSRSHMVRMCQGASAKFIHKKDIFLGSARTGVSRLV